MPETTTEYQYNPALVDVALDNVGSQFRCQPVFRAILEGLVAPFQEVEDIAFDIINSRILESATGVSLDYWGGIVDEKRGGLTDGEYRSIITGKIQVSIHDGTIESLIRIAQALTAPSTVIVDCNTTGLIYISVVRDDVMSDEYRARVGELLALAKTASVSMVAVEASSNYFGFNGNTLPTVGGFDVGQFAELITVVS